MSGGGSGRIVGIGGATLDRKYLAKARLRAGTSNPVAAARLGFGGVARNVIETLARLGSDASLITLVGDDENGHLLLRHLRDRGADTSAVMVRAGQRTAEYIAALEPDGQLALGLADMNILDGFTLADLDRADAWLAAASWVFADCNLPADILAALLRRRHRARFRLAIDAVSTPKAARLPENLSGLDLLFVNWDEARAYLAATGRPQCATAPATALALRAAGAAQLVLTLGENGLLVAEGDEVEAIPAVPAKSVDVTGVGDALIAAVLFGLGTGKSLAAAARLGTLLAALTIEVEASVHPELSPAWLDANLRPLTTAAPEAAQ
jgi:pseudouridine kinase